MQGGEFSAPLDLDHRCAAQVEAHEAEQAPARPSAHQRGRAGPRERFERNAVVFLEQQSVFANTRAEVRNVLGDGCDRSGIQSVQGVSRVAVPQSTMPFKALSRPCGRR